MSENVIKSKNYSGTFAGGQGPIHGVETKSEKENSGILGGEFKDRIKTTKSEGGVDVRPSSEGAKNFDLQGKSYRGPENWQPTDAGTSNPGDVKSS